MSTGEIVVYLHPARYTRELLQGSDTFTVSFFPENRKKDLAYMGTHSGRDGNKVAATGLTPVPFAEGVTYEEANLTFLCKKLYQHPFSKECLASEIQEYYIANPGAYPLNENGEWQAHWVFVGEILEIADKR